MKQLYKIKVTQKNEEWLADYDEYGISVNAPTEELVLEAIKEKIIKEAIVMYDYESSPVRRNDCERPLSANERVIAINIDQEIKTRLHGAERITITIPRDVRYRLSEYVDNFSAFFSQAADAYVRNRRRREKEIETIDDLIKGVNNRILQEFVKQYLQNHSFDSESQKTPFRPLSIVKPSNSKMKLICYKEIGSFDSFVYSFARYLTSGELIYQVVGIEDEESQFDFGTYREDIHVEESGFYLVSSGNGFDDILDGCSDGYRVISDKVINNENYEVLWMNIPNPM